MITFHWAYLVLVPILFIEAGLYFFLWLSDRNGWGDDDELKIIVALAFALTVSIFGGIFWW